MNSAFRCLLSILFFIALNLVFFNLLSENIESPIESDAIATITTDNETELLEAVKTLNKNGGTIYIKTPVINISTKSTIKITGSTAGGLVGKKLSDGTYPRLDFKNARDAGSSARGITISGTNQYIKYLIIENSGDNGIWISGANNTIDHVIARYTVKDIL